MYQTVMKRTQGLEMGSKKLQLAMQPRPPRRAALQHHYGQSAEDERAVATQQECVEFAMVPQLDQLHQADIQN
jgi:hypothetical protein